MSSISSINSSILSSYFTTGTSSSSRSSKSDTASAMAEDLFAQLDTTGKGYIEESDLVSAFSQVSSSDSTSSTSTSAEDVFAKLDSDSDGKVTEDELTSGLEALAAALDTQLNQMRMNSAMPPPPESDSGFTQEELESQLSEISSSGSTDSARSELLSSVVANFESADSDSDGKVTFDEAMAYTQSASSSSSSTSSTSASNISSTTSSDSGFTLSELEAQLSEIESTDSTRSDLLTRIIANFDTADTNQDGTVSNAEAMAYDQSTTATSSSAVAATGSSSGSSSSSSDSSNSSQTSSELAILKRIMDLMQSYASVGTTSSSTVSASA